MAFQPDGAARSSGWSSGARGTPGIACGAGPEPLNRRAPPQWGNPAIIAERLGDKFAPPFFERGVMKFSALSIPHFRLFMERSVGPMQKLIESLAADPQKLERFRAEFDALAAPYHFDNMMHRDNLLTRAQVA
jgi:hypothetical protein